MYTHLHISHDSAEELFAAFARKPLGPGEYGVVTEATLDLHFAQYGHTHLDRLGAALEQDRRPDPAQYVLKFSEYLAHMPAELLEMGIEVIKAEIVRMNSAPTRATAGFYENPDNGFSATVERVYPHGQYHGKATPLYAQNIWVNGPSLAAVQEFNTELSSGHFNHFMVASFE